MSTRRFNKDIIKMNIIVCIKQVPDTSEMKIDRETNNLIRLGVSGIINPCDLYAIEAALQAKEVIGGKVIALTMGPSQAECSLRDAIAYGVDEAVLLTGRAFAGSDTLATAYTLSKAIEKLGFDIIFCGKQAIDGDTAQVGPGVAELLDIPHITYVKKIEKIAEDNIRVQRLMEGGYDIVESTIPVLLTVVKELNEPRMQTLRGKMAAIKANITRFGAEDIGAEATRVGLKGSPTRVKKIFTPPVRVNKKILTGTAQEQATELVGELKRLRWL